LSRFIAAPGLLDRRVTSILTRRHVNSLECFWVIPAAIGEPIAGCGFTWSTGVDPRCWGCVRQGGGALPGFSATCSDGRL